MTKTRFVIIAKHVSSFRQILNLTILARSDWKLPTDDSLEQDITLRIIWSAPYDGIMRLYCVQDSLGLFRLVVDISIA